MPGKNAVVLLGLYKESYTSEKNQKSKVFQYKYKYIHMYDFLYLELPK